MTQLTRGARLVMNRPGPRILTAAGVVRLVRCPVDAQMRLETLLRNTPILKIRPHRNANALLSHSGAF